MPTQVQLLKKYNVVVRGHVGQHLLIDPNLQNKIVELLEIAAGEPVLEIGPGLGALTGPLLERGAKVTAVEKDEAFVKILKEEWGRAYPKRLKVIHEDFLKYEIASSSFRTPRNLDLKIKVIGNLPYYLTAPILFHLLDRRQFFSKAVLMMQKEVADRLLASPGTKNYGRLTLGVRYAADIAHAFDVARKCFIPPPEVDSTVIVMTFHAPSARLKDEDEKFLFELIRIAFSQRRKTLANLLSHDPNLGVERQDILKIFEALGMSSKVRGEELLLKDYFNLAEKLKKG